MGRYKYLLKNIGLLTLSSFATKLLSFFLVPLYTSILTTGEYGAYDIINTTVAVLIPILTQNIQDAALRFALEEKYDRDAIVTVSVRMLMRSCIIVGGGLAVNYIFGFSSLVKKYVIFFLLMYLVQSLSGIVLAYIRGIERIRELSLSSAIASLITIGCNLLFLVVFKWGIDGYFLANLTGPVIQCVFLIINAGMISNIHPECEYRNESEAMLAYSRPLILSGIAWWINSVSDRYVVIWFCGIAETGVYSVASKIPAILNVFQNIFNQAWTLSAVKDYDREDKDGFFSEMYNDYGALMVCGCSVLIAMTRFLAKILFANDFYRAWRYVPFLLIGVIFGALSAFIGGIFSAIKKPEIIAGTTMAGACLNIVMNLVLVPEIGALGASISTFISYWLVYFLRIKYMKKYLRIKLHLKRDYITYGILSAQSVLLILFEKGSVRLYLAEALCVIFEIILYGREFKRAWIRLVNYYGEKNK